LNRRILKFLQNRTHAIFAFFPDFLNDVLQEIICVFAGVVPKPTRQVPKAGEAAAEGAGPVGDSGVQRHDAKYLPNGHPSVPTVSTPQLHQQHEQQIFAGTHAL
jgi:hypothetical protein